MSMGFSSIASAINSNFQSWILPSLKVIITERRNTRASSVIPVIILSIRTLINHPSDSRRRQILTTLDKLTSLRSPGFRLRIGQLPISTEKSIEWAVSFRSRVTRRRADSIKRLGTLSNMMRAKSPRVLYNSIFTTKLRVLNETFVVKFELEMKAHHSCCHLDQDLNDKRKRSKERRGWKMNQRDRLKLAKKVNGWSLDDEEPQTNFVSDKRIFAAWIFNC